jgi:hypothetical protein
LEAKVSSDIVNAKEAKLTSSQQAEIQQAMEKQ